MSVYKELFQFAEEVKKKSHQIYPDAADYGVRIENYNNPIIVNLKLLIGMYNGKVTTTRYATGATQEIFILGFDEWNTKKEVEFVFNYVHIRKKRCGDPQGYLYLQH
jgi:hypothetical protein